MISSNVIYTSLILLFAAGIIPIIIGIILLASKKLKGSAFWCGVVANIIITILVAIPTAYLTLTNMDMLTSQSFNIGLQIAYAILNTIALAVSIYFVLQASRNFKGAISCGVGFSVVNLITTGLGMISIYASSMMINNGTFDNQYTEAIKQGVMTKEMFLEAKKSFLDLTASSLILSVVNVVAVGLLYVAMSILIIKGLYLKKKLIFTSAALAMHLVVSFAGSLIANSTVAIVAITAIGAAALICASRLVKEPEIPPAPKPDPFMQSIEGAKKDTFNADLNLDDEIL